jgi:amino acid transporter
MLTTGKRPRQLHWFHAGPMLFGDWGTSRLYVLGICFAHAKHASFWFMLAMSLLLMAVGWAYSVVCRLYPDGGGVYSSARHKSQLLAVIGALLLCADYVVTAALSALDAFHYLEFPRPELWAAGSVLLIGILNYFGPTKSGWFALGAALLTIVCSATIGLASLPSLVHAEIIRPPGNFGNWWSQFTAIILAISGVEAVANMTGIMVEPVAKTARKSIWPVLAEIIALNLLLTLAMSAVPLEVLGKGDPETGYTAHYEDMLRLLAEFYVGHKFALLASIVFAALLLSAVNTAVTGLVSIQYMMARDRELPQRLTGLNAWGMPLLPLIIGVVVPTATVILAPDVGHLADLYAIGVVGAVVLNLSTCSISLDLPMKLWERIGMSILSLLLIGIWITIAWEKPHALMFAGTIVAAGLGARWATQHRVLLGRALQEAGEKIAGAEAALEFAGAYTPAAKFLLATRGNPKLVRFALEQAQKYQAELLVLYAQQVAVPLLGPTFLASLEENPEARGLFEMVRTEAKELGVPIREIYAVTSDIADTILDFAATFAADRVILGSTQRGALWRTMKGDVIQGVAQHLPERTTLLIHA